MVNRDLQSKTAIFAKGFLFLGLGLLSGGLLLASIFSIWNVVLLGLTVWSFCRFYYFAFYVIEHYVDSGYHFSGLVDFAKYWFRSKK